MSWNTAPLTEHGRRMLLSLMSTDDPIPGSWQEARDLDKRVLAGLESRRMVMVNRYFNIVRVTDTGRWTARKLGAS